ncbi:unnamed protein product [Lathyrus sativus]|nr:unnamed protein product [Lathyrus sativus]
MSTVNFLVNMVVVELMWGQYIVKWCVLLSFFCSTLESCAKLFVFKTSWRCMVHRTNSIVCHNLSGMLFLVFLLLLQKDEVCVASLF